MKEITFRAWDKKREGFHCNIETYDWFQPVFDDFEELDFSDFITNNERFDVQQYTGLKDRNGTEIYEGDILLVPDEWTEPILDDGSGPTDPCNHLGPVVFKRGSFGVDVSDSADFLPKGFSSLWYILDYIGYKPDEIEVIGNVYENPELLEDK